MKWYKWHILLLAGLVGPTAFSVLFYGFLNTENRENRELAVNPFTQEDTTIVNLPERLETYYEDHLPLKNEIADVKSTVDYDLFRESSNPEVVIGKEGWLFFSSPEHGDQLADYMGEKHFTEEEAATIASYLNVANEYFSYAGIQFIVAIVPGKERVYPQYLPDEYGDPMPGRGEEMYTYLAQNCPGIDVIWLYDELKNYSDTHEELTYYKTDTHWNHLGAYLGARRILSDAGFALPEPTKENLVEYDPGGGDLVNMLGMNPATVSDVDYELQNELSFSYVTEGGDVMSQMYFSSDTDSGKSAVILGDSFTIILSEELAGHFTQLCYYRRYGNNTENLWDIIERIHPDVFIYETGDRYLDQVGILANPLRVPGFYALHPELEYGIAGREAQPVVP